MRKDDYERVGVLDGLLEVRDSHDVLGDLDTREVLRERCSLVSRT